MEKENASEKDALYHIVILMNIVHLVTNAMMEIVSIWGNVGNLMTVDLDLIVMMDFVRLK